uniref:CoA transferase n=1 Tax=Steinernema glaseri TaxID=37863 RepID=A0A1I8A8G8_9BILA
MFSKAVSSPLAGIRIADFTRILAGPYATMILGDLGAEVWKIERPGTGDDVRNWVPPRINDQSCYYLCLNRNKKSLAIDLQHPDGQRIAKALALKSDVLMENFKTGGLEKLGLGYSELSKENERLIYCSITGWGATGPYAKHGGFDVIAEAVGGFMAITGPKDGEPCKAGVAVIDMMTGLYAHGAILAALMQRSQTGKGQKIDCNLLSTQITALMNIGSNYLNAGLEGRRWGTEHESIIPYQAFATKDGRHYVVGAGNDAAFAKLVKHMGLESLASDEKFKSNANRVKNREELLKIIQDRFLQEDLKFWQECLDDSGLPSGPVNTLAEAYSHPQVKHLGLVQKVQHASYGEVTLTAPPVEFSGAENRIRSAPPLLGEHTKEILQRELDFSDATLDRLKHDRVIDF